MSPENGAANLIVVDFLVEAITTQHELITGFNIKYIQIEFQRIGCADCAGDEI